ncbi:glycosyltransferase [Bradyrhizobium japonicum]|uniref:glycosyltransferase n=1 Tax=Bradyrhizobium japonicum TaxID=375 RepID=UPI001BACB94F|nr:glycosyltransferase [Bradyrhizobium japonicum]MBR0995457.1 glycosyltransferase [Bradyrhizobium japonicum]
MDDSMSCILHASANLVLVKDGNRGAGHITAVAGMMLGTPQISSNMDVLNDYLIGGFNCISVPPGNIDAIRDAVNTILLYPNRRMALVANGVAFASRWLTHSAAQKRVFESIDRMLENKPQQIVDPQWTDFMSEIAAGSAVNNADQ